MIIIIYLNLNVKYQPIFVLFSLNFEFFLHNLKIKHMKWVFTPNVHVLKQHKGLLWWEHVASGTGET